MLRELRSALLHSEGLRRARLSLREVVRGQCRPCVFELGWRQTNPLNFQFRFVAFMMADRLASAQRLWRIAATARLPSSMASFAR